MLYNYQGKLYKMPGGFLRWSSISSAGGLKEKGKVCFGPVAHPAGAYPGFCSMKWLGVFLLHPGWDASPSQGYPPALNSQVPIVHLGAERHYQSKCLAQEHNTMTPARTRIRTARSGVQRTNHETTVPPLQGLVAIHNIGHVSSWPFLLSTNLEQ